MEWIPFMDKSQLLCTVSFFDCNFDSSVTVKFISKMHNPEQTSHFQLEEADLQVLQMISKTRPTEPISTEKPFVPDPVLRIDEIHGWNTISGLERVKGISSEARVQLSSLERRKYTSEVILSSLSQIQVKAQEILQLHQNVQNVYHSIDKATRDVLVDQSRLLQSADRIAEGLLHFQEAGSLSIRLSSTSKPLDFTGPTEFLQVLERLDRSMDFLEAYPMFKESQAFLHKFRNLHILLLSKLKTFIAQTLENATKVIHKSDEQSEELSQQRQVIELRSLSNVLRPFFAFLESKSSPKYRKAVLECQQIYYEARHISVCLQLQRQFRSKMEPSLPVHSRDLCFSLISTLAVEFQLFSEFFSVSSALSGNILQDHLNGICGVLYTHLRPLVIQETQLDSLCDMCDVLRFDILEEQVIPRGEALEPMVQVIERIVEDIQERLVYVSQIYIRDHVSVASKVTKSEVESGDGKYWHPILEKTLLCLSKLFRCLDRHVFTLVAQTFVKECVDALALKSGLMVKVNEGDGNLFLIQQLMVLREQIVPFELDLGIPDSVLDFSRMKGIFGVLRGEVSIMNFVKSSAPEIVHAEINAKKVMEEQLRNACQVFINQSTNDLVGVLLEFMASVAGDVKMEIQENEMDAVSRAAVEQFETVYPVLKSKLDSSVDVETLRILLTPIKRNVSHAVDEFADFVKNTWNGRVDVNSLLEIKIKLR